MSFMIGEKVVYQMVVCTVCKPEHNNSAEKIWIDNPERGYKHHVSEENLKSYSNFLFCSGDKNPLKADTDERRFYVKSFK